MLFQISLLMVFLMAVSCVSPQTVPDLADVETPTVPSAAETAAAEEAIEDASRDTAAVVLPAMSHEVVLKQSLNGLDPQKADKLEADAKAFLAERKKYGQTGAFIRQCANEENHPFCLAYKYKYAPVDRNREPRKPRASRKSVQKSFAKKDYEALKKIDFQSLIPIAKKLKFENLKDLSKEVAANPQCLSEDLYAALGSALEFDFPNDESVTLNNQLLSRAQKCFTSDFTLRAVFRLGMFKVWKNHCDEAIPLFDLSLSNQSVKYLHARSVYWREWCRTKKANPEAPAENSAASSQFYNNFPQSFHALLADDGPTPMAYNLLTNNVEPQVKFRSAANTNLNGFLDALDTFVKIGETQIAFWLLEGISSEKLKAEEPELNLYIAIICNRVQAGLAKFQILTKLFERTPSFRTIKTMRLFYPDWYMDKVISYKNRVNPYLIMALIRQESAFNSRAHSTADARGLMQLLPGTGRTFGRVKKGDLFNPEKNIASGVRFFTYLMERYDNQVPLALAAYNAGPLTVDGWVKRYPTDNPLLFIDIIPYRETREYVGSILRNWYWYNKLYAETYPSQSSNDDPIAKVLFSSP